MNIKQSVYDNLTNDQRIEAMVSAIKRNDPTEIERLIKGVARKVYEMPDAEFTDKLIEKVLDDASLQNKAGVYRSLQRLLMREETAHQEQSKLLVQWVDENGMVFDTKTGTKKLAEGITNPELIERYKRWQEYEATSEREHHAN